MKNHQLAALVLGLGALTLSSSVFSSNLHIKNENAKDLIVSIQAEGSSSESLHWMEVTIPAKGEKDVVVSDEAMGGKKTFSVRGKVNPLTAKGISSNMDITKNYTLTFKDLSLGTECVCELAKD